MDYRPQWLGFVVVLSMSSCGNLDVDVGQATEATSAGMQSTDTGANSDGIDESGHSGTQKLDISNNPPNLDQCSVNDGLNGVIDCEDEAPADSFDPVLEWAWSPTDAADGGSVVTPLVANLTDDDGNGVIDLCDTPDIVVVSRGTNVNRSRGHLFVIDGASGAVHWRSEDYVGSAFTPALGDIDGDGFVEIVGSRVLPGGEDMDTWQLVAWEHDGSIKFAETFPEGTELGNDLPPVAIKAIALADLDNDGDVEIVLGPMIYDHEGQLINIAPGDGSFGNWHWSIDLAVTVVDLDGDGDLEIVGGRRIWDHEGIQRVSLGGDSSGFPSVADFDADGEPEILISRQHDGLSMYEADGTPIFVDQKPVPDPKGFSPNTWNRASAVHDLDGDGVPEFVISTADTYGAYEANLDIMWQTPVSDLSGVASSTAFDFLGDGRAEAMYGDEDSIFVFGDQGQELMQLPRRSPTYIEYPVVADVDNDGSAEIIFTSESDPVIGQDYPTLQVFGDADDRWIPARRIWNQHTYHVTNVLEDGRIPQFEQPHWQTLNTFRTQAQIEENGGLCVPPVG
ncbi:MAG: VCBS repeat-containing protein [Myxococcota bacterium]